MDLASRPPASLADGRYVIAEVIGTGGMGEVRAGRDLRLGRDVAIKLLRADMASQPAIRQRFEDEARLAARLLHPNVVAVFDSGEENGIPYLVMERLSGRTLGDDIAAGPLDADTVRALGIQILDALDAAHAASLVHRDVKPGNVLAAAPGTWKVGDFGIAKSLEASDPTLTVLGMIIGTPAYLAPERLAGGPATVASDLYAAGAVLYEALTGRRPLPDGVAPVGSAATRVPLDEVRPDVPPLLAGVVMRAMAHNPADRFATAADMAAALRRAEPAEGLGDTVIVPGAESVIATQLLTAPPSAATAPRTPSLARRLSMARPRLAAVAAPAVAVIVVVIVAVSASGHGRRATSPPTTGPAVTAPALPAPLEAALQRLEREVRR